jgi:hypothetical protein
MKSIEFKKEWINGFSLCWRILVLVIIIRLIYGLGTIAAVMVVGTIGNESLLNPILGIFTWIGILIFPIVVSIAADNVNLKVSKIGFPLSRQMKTRREPVDADNQITRP